MLIGLRVNNDDTNIANFNVCMTVGICTLVIRHQRVLRTPSGLWKTRRCRQTRRCLLRIWKTTGPSDTVGSLENPTVSSDPAVFVVDLEDDPQVLRTPSGLWKTRRCRQTQRCFGDRQKKRPPNGGSPFYEKMENNYFISVSSLIRLVAPANLSMMNRT